MFSIPSREKNGGRTNVNLWLIFHPPLLDRISMLHFGHFSKSYCRQNLKSGRVPVRVRDRRPAERENLAQQQVAPPSSVNRCKECPPIMSSRNPKFRETSEGSFSAASKPIFACRTIFAFPTCFPLGGQKPSRNHGRTTKPNYKIVNFPKRNRTFRFMQT